MSDDNKDLGDKAEEAFDKAKDAAKEAAGDAKEAAGDFADEAKKTANEFSEGVKDTLNAENKKMLAGILAIILGALRYTQIYLRLSKRRNYNVSYLRSLRYFHMWYRSISYGYCGLIEGIIYLTKSDEEFYNTYQVGKNLGSNV